MTLLCILVSFRSVRTEDGYRLCKNEQFGALISRQTIPPIDTHSPVSKLQYFLVQNQHWLETSHWQSLSSNHKQTQTRSPRSGQVKRGDHTCSLRLLADNTTLSNTSSPCDSREVSVASLSFFRAPRIARLSSVFSGRLTTEGSGKSIPQAHRSGLWSQSPTCLSSSFGLDKEMLCLSTNQSYISLSSAFQRVYVNTIHFHLCCFCVSYWGMFKWFQHIFVSLEHFLFIDNQNK